MNILLSHVLANVWGVSAVQAQSPSSFPLSQLSGIIQKAPCPDTEAYDDCFYPATPTTTSPNNSVTWTCTAGSFCLAPGNSEACTPGFYCPTNTAQPIFCPARYSCSADTTTIQRCPDGFFCPVGAVVPFRCWLAICPAGTSKAPKTYLILILALIALLILFLFQRKKYSDKLKAVRHRQQVYEMLTNLSNSKMHTGLPTSHQDDKRTTFQIEFENLGLKLPSGLTIMNKVSGRLCAGRCCAIMGPSGAGKTTFVSLLTGKLQRTAGSIVINGRREELTKYKRLIGFVPQDDIMLSELTVRDVLMHSAKMRLPRFWSLQKVERHVLELMTFLGLSRIMDNVIGSPDVVGPRISGGQRKRVNLAIEAVADPSILFLDEPTSGLDSSTSYEVCRMLKALAHERGILVGAIIHSPSPQAFRQFDDLLLLGKGGHVVYFGAREEAVSYLSRCGFACPTDASPPDFFMDVLMGKIPSEIDPNFMASDLNDYWKRYLSGRPPVQMVDKFRLQSPGFKLLENLPNPEKARIQELQNEASGFYLGMTRSGSSSRPSSPITAGPNSAFRSRPDSASTRYEPEYKLPPNFCHRIQRAFAQFVWSAVDQCRGAALWILDVCTELLSTFRGWISCLCCIEDPVRETPPTWRKFYLLFHRACLQNYRSRGAFLFDQTLHLGCGVFISIAVQNFDYLSRQPESVCQIAPVMLQATCREPIDFIRYAAVFMSLGVLFAGISAGSQTFGRERVVYWRDTSAGMPTSAYYFAKVLADLPRVLAASILFSMAYILFVSYRSSFGAIFVIALLLYLNAFAIGRKEAIALAGTGFALAWALVFSGVLPDLTEVFTDFSSIQFLWDLSAPRWAVEAYWIQEVGARPFVEDKPPNTPPYTYNWDDFGKACGNMLLIALLWNVLAFLGLKLFNRQKMK